jgi:hypothetical protein
MNMAAEVLALSGSLLVAQETVKVTVSESGPSRLLSGALTDMQQPCECLCLLLSKALKPHKLMQQ